ncbi:hypothetical protein OIU79_008185 [Salix purpurea]|uniref:Non-haem dioxygenase N-terminal domain-containing protein n=1 Tax=Salix purpurea TaxID=77065 RepID=A0A9Q0THS1_SALPP|nr:hypothetical protein OIU79_008185 [Salix purpurea]
MDLSSPDRISAANSSRQACADCGFFYLVNHGVEQELPGKRVSIPFQVPKLFMKCNENKNLEIVHSKEGFYVGHVEGDSTRINLNQ